MKSALFEAFRAVCLGFSADRVVADPALNAMFIEHCRSLGLSASATELNLTLLNLRKAGLLKNEIPSKKTSFLDQEEYRYASEVAARHLERRYSTTLDRIICDPQLAAEFDRLAGEIAPGYTSLQYRWAALNLRKARSLRPELLSHIVCPKSVSLGAIDKVVVNELPTCQGLYLFYGPQETLYVGEASNLRRRIGKHLDHSDNKNLARWFWLHGFQDVHLEVQTLDDGTTSKVRKALEAELISTRHPLFNIQQVRNARKI